MASAIPQIHIIHHRRFLELNSLPLRDDVQRPVNVRQMPQRQVSHKHALDLVVAHAPVHPSQEDDQLCPHRKHHDYVRPTRTSHVFSFGVLKAKPSFLQLKARRKPPKNHQINSRAAALASRSLLSAICYCLTTKTIPALRPAPRRGSIRATRKILRYSAKHLPEHSAAPRGSPAFFPKGWNPRQITPKVPATPPSAAERPCC